MDAHYPYIDTSPSLNIFKDTSPLHLGAPTFRELLTLLGPSLALWRAAEIAILRRQVYKRPILDLGCGDGLVTSMALAPLPYLDTNNPFLQPPVGAPFMAPTGPGGADAGASKPSSPLVSPTMENLALSRIDIALDPDEKALAQAAQRGIYERCEAVPAEDARLPNASIATIVSNSVLEHLPRIDAVLANAARLLRPGGRLIFTTPTEAFSRWLFLPSSHYAVLRNSQLAHLNLWSVERWAHTLRQAGLLIESVQPYLTRPLVWTWDALELLQQVWLFHRRLFSLFWRRIPPNQIERLARWASQLDLSSPNPGGGRLIVARKP